MKLLKIINQSYDWNKEFEIFCNEGLVSSDQIELFCSNKHLWGFDCTVTYLNGNVEVRHNITEFHHRYDIDEHDMSHPSFESTDEDAKYFTGGSAFESDIHKTGGTVELNTVQEISIVYATELHDRWNLKQ